MASVSVGKSQRRSVLPSACLAHRGKMIVIGLVCRQQEVLVGAAFAEGAVPIYMRRQTVGKARPFEHRMTHYLVLERRGILTQ